MQTSKPAPQPQKRLRVTRFKDKVTVGVTCDRCARVCGYTYYPLQSKPGVKVTPGLLLTDAEYRVMALDDHANDCD